MSNYNQRDNQSDQKAPEQFNPAFAGDPEQEFAYTEASKPVNRNLIVLLLIAVVGASLIYLMYLRGRFKASEETLALAKDQDTVNVFIASANENMAKLDSQLAKTKDTVDMLQASPDKGQVPTRDLKVNPFSLGTKEKGPTVAAAAIPRIQSDPMDEIGAAIKKVKVEMILLQGTASSAAINNRICRVGDKITVESVVFTVKAISANGVVLKHAMGEFTVNTASAKPM